MEFITLLRATKKRRPVFCTNNQIYKFDVNDNNIIHLKEIHNNRIIESFNPPQNDSDLSCIMERARSYKECKVATHAPWSDIDFGGCPECKLQDMFNTQEESNSRECPICYTSCAKVFRGSKRLEKLDCGHILCGGCYKNLDRTMHNDNWQLRVKCPICRSFSVVV